MTKLSIADFSEQTHSLYLKLCNLLVAIRHSGSFCASVRLAVGATLELWLHEVKFYANAVGKSNSTVVSKLYKVPFRNFGLKSLKTHFIHETKARTLKNSIQCIWE